MREWLKLHYDDSKRARIAAPKEGFPCLDIAGLRLYEAQLLKKCSGQPAITYTEVKEWLEQTHGVTCTKNTMMHWMQSPFKSKVVASIDELRKDHLYFLKTVYNDNRHFKISRSAVRIQLAVRRDRTASNVDMNEYMSLLPRDGGRPPLRTKTSLAGPMIVNVDDLSPYLDQLYFRIAEEPLITSQRLSAYFVADRCRFLILLR